MVTVIPKLSKALRTRSNDLNHKTSNWGSFIFPCIGLIWTLGLKAAAVLAAIWREVSVRPTTHMGDAPELCSVLHPFF